MTRDYLPPDAVDDALALIGAVRDYSPEAVAMVLGRADLPALCVALAAMVDDEQSPAELLRWNDSIEAVVARRNPKLPVPVMAEGARDVGRNGQSLRPCGTHAAYTRHKMRGELLDDACVVAEKAYHAARGERRSRAERAHRGRLTVAYAPPVRTQQQR